MDQHVRDDFLTHRTVRLLVVFLVALILTGATYTWVLANGTPDWCEDKGGTWVQIYKGSWACVDSDWKIVRP